MKCKIIFERDPKTLKVTDKIKAVKAPNGQKSILFDDIRNQVVDDKLSLETYYKTYTDEFKNKVKGVGKDKNDEVIFEEVKDIILPSNLLNKSVIKESDRIIWGHPALGKTTALESNPNLFIDWDVEFNSKRDKWIEDKSGTIKGTPEYKKARNEYLINYNKYPDYIQFLTNEWNKAKQKAKQENKKLLASPHMLLNLFPNDFDKIINISDDVFMDRAVKRSGGDEVNSRLWKEGINKTLENVDKSKVITTDKYLSDLLPSRMLASVGDGLYSSSDVKPGVDYVFEQNKELAKIGSKEDYSDYLDTIFPDSKVKDIVYHGTQNSFDINEGFNLNKKGSNRERVLTRDNLGIYVTKQKEFADTFQDKEFNSIMFPHYKPTTIPLIVNVNKPYYLDNIFTLDDSEIYEGDPEYYSPKFIKSEELTKIENNFNNNINDSLVTKGGRNRNKLDADYIVLKEPSQIHILGSIKDIAQFSHYIKTRKASTSSGIQSNNIRSKYFADNDTQSHKDILQKIVDNNEGFSPLAKKLLTINSKNVPITLKPVNVLYSFTDNFGNKQEAAAMYQNGRIEMSEFANYKGGKYGFESNVIHEILHAFTYNELRLNSKNAQELKAIYQEALKYKDSFSDQYSISNIDEFLVAIFTNANFIKDIQKIPSIYPEKHQSLWEDVLEFFKKWFQFNNKEASLLDDAFYVANKILIDYSNDPDQTRYKEQSVRESNEAMSDEYVWTDDEGNPLYSSEKYDNIDDSAIGNKYLNGNNELFSDLTISNTDKGLLMKLGYIDTNDGFKHKTKELYIKEEDVVYKNNSRVDDIVVDNKWLEFNKKSNTIDKGDGNVYINNEELLNNLKIILSDIDINNVLDNFKNVNRLHINIKNTSDGRKVRFHHGDNVKFYNIKDSIINNPKFSASDNSLLQNEIEELDLAVELDNVLKGEEYEWINYIFKDNPLLNLNFTDPNRDIKYLEVQLDGLRSTFKTLIDNGEVRNSEIFTTGNMTKADHDQLMLVSNWREEVYFNNYFDFIKDLKDDLETQMDSSMNNVIDGIDEKVDKDMSDNLKSLILDSSSKKKFDVNKMQENYILQDESNVELAKMIMSGITNNTPPLASPSDPADTQIEDQFKLRNEDGSRKRYTENKALELARKLNKANPDRPFKFTVIKVMGEKGDNRVYHAVKVVPREDKLFSLSDADYKGQPQITKPDSIKLDIDAFQAMVGPNGYSTDQMAIMEVYNRNTEGMVVEKKDVLVSELPDKKLRETYEKKGVKIVKRYKTKDGYILYRVSDRQDMIKVAGMTAEKAVEQENNPKSVLARQRGTEMHDLNQRILEMLVNSNNPAFGIDPYRQLDFNLWFGDGVTPGAFEVFKLSDEYKQLQKEGREIFDNRSDSDAFGDTYKISDSTKQVDKLVKSMMRLYHQVHLIQKDINVKNNTNHKPIFLTETVLVDKGANEAGTMDIAVIFSDGTASIYDHKFTDLQAVRFDYPKDKAKQDWAEIKRIRTAQGLPVDNSYNDNQAWYYTLPDHIDLYKREDSWNAQIGRYSEMLTKLYGVKSIRQARILPVATSYTKVDKEFTPESKVAVILTGDDDFGISQIALEVEKTGDVALDRFIQMLLANKHALAKERLEKKAYDDPKYNERIRKLDASIQALLLSRDVTKIADSIQALADQIQIDLDSVDVPITFTDIINHLKEIEMYESFISATAGELDAMKDKYAEQIKKNEVNPYTTFIQRLGVAKSELGLAAKSMHDKMTSMIYEENKKGNFMSSALFKSFEKQVDMSEMGKFFTHLREVNHPIVSLFSQLLDKVATNRLNERRELEVKINELNKELSKWGDKKGLKGPAVYKSILDDKLNLIHKFKHYVKEDFKDHLDQKNHKDNIKWFKENFHRTGANEEKFQARLKLEKESINKTAKSEQEKYERLEKWLDANDVNHKDGDNKAWYNQYVQYWLTPLDPEEYYTDQYKELLKSENKPLLDFYNFYTNHMVELSKKVDFKVSETMVAEIRKDTIDTMVQDGIFAGWKQQGHNMFNYFSKHDKDDGFQTIDDGTKNGKKVPIFFTDSVGVENKSFDLAKSLMIYSDFVNNYSGVKDMEHAVLAMRELVSKTRGVKTNWKGQVGRNAAGDIDLKEGPNEKLLEAFDKWINYYIYGETKEGDPFQNKVVDAMTSVSSRKSVALNFLSAVGGHINAAAQLDMIASKAFQFDDKILKAGRKEAERFKLFRETMGKGKDATEALDSKSMFANFFFEIQQDDLSYEKANSVSLSTMRKAMSKDYAFILQRWSDHVIDSTTLNAMLMSYGIDPNTGKTYPIKRLQEMYANDPKYKDLEWKSLWDSLDLENKDKDGNKQPVFINQHTPGEKISDATYTDFRRKAKHLISKAKGNMSSEDIAGYRTHMIGRLVMQFRGWIPATVRERVKGEQYSLTMEQFEVGRWIAAYEMVGKNLKRTAGEFIKQMLPFVKADFNKNMNDPLHPMKVKYEQYIADNPHLKPDPLNPAPEHITYEQYYNTYVGEVKALAREVQTYLALAGFLGLMMFAAGDDELKENPILRLATALTNRVMLEIGFYAPIIGASEQYNLLVRQPVSSLSLLADASKAVSNTFSETYDIIYGAGWGKTVTPKLGDDGWELDYSSRTDATPWRYYSHQFIPPVNFLFNVFEPLNITDRKDTVYDYLLDNSEMVYRY